MAESAERVCGSSGAGPFHHKLSDAAEGQLPGRVFTTEMVAYPGTVHIGPEKDFTPVIEKALRAGRFSGGPAVYGINGGMTVSTGFGHGIILSLADQVIAAG